jgi:hypothetical protein
MEKRERGPGMVKGFWGAVVVQMERRSSGLLMRAGASLAADGDRINVVPWCKMIELPPNYQANRY